MARYKCSEPNCKNKEKYDNKGFCPDCGAKLRKTSNLLPIIGIGALLLIGLLVVGALTMPTTNTTDLNDTTETKTTPTPVVEAKIFENDYCKFTIPEGTTVKESSDGKALEFNDPKLNEEFEGESVPYGDMSLSGDVKQSSDSYVEYLLSTGYTLRDKKISGYEVYSKKFTGNPDTYDIQVIIPAGSITKLGWLTFDIGSEKQMNIILDSLVIK